MCVLLAILLRFSFVAQPLGKRFQTPALNMIAQRVHDIVQRDTKGIQRDTHFVSPYVSLIITSGAEQLDVHAFS